MYLERVSGRWALRLGTLIYGWQALDSEGSHSAGRLQRYNAAENIADEDFTMAQTLYD